MRLVCKYCGYCVEYENGKGWFPEYAGEVTQHILDKHVRITAIEDHDDNGKLSEIMYGALVDPGYSANWNIGVESKMTYDGEHPPYEPWPPDKTVPNC